MSTHHEMTFEPNGDYELMVECIDKGRVSAFTLHGEYHLNDERLTVVSHLYTGDLPTGTELYVNDTTEYRVAVEGRKLYIYDERYNSTLIYRR